ncbi:hypothetical protein P3G55_24690, partial [Leptospira sp. 96542]|nr:hypothetical protein [Leptospira sp. 96542]
MDRKHTHRPGTLKTVLRTARLPTRGPWARETTARGAGAPDLMAAGAGKRDAHGGMVRSTTICS